MSRAISTVSDDLFTALDRIEADEKRRKDEDAAARNAAAAVLKAEAERAKGVLRCTLLDEPETNPSEKRPKWLSKSVLKKVATKTANPKLIMETFALQSHHQQVRRGDFANTSNTKRKGKNRKKRKSAAKGEAYNDKLNSKARRKARMKQLRTKY